MLHTTMGTIKDRNSEDLTENYTRKILKDPDKHDGVVTHLQPDILECDVKWALGSITMNKSSGRDRMSAELFKMMLYSICPQILKTQQWPEDGKGIIFIPMPKNVLTTVQLLCSFHVLARYAQNLSS